jgi:hypothetical protein
MNHQQLQSTLWLPRPAIELVARNAEAAWGEIQSHRNPTILSFSGEILNAQAHFSPLDIGMTEVEHLLISKDPIPSAATVLMHVPWADLVGHWGAKD